MSYKKYFFNKLEEKLDKTNKRIAIYGTGNHTELLLHSLNEKNKEKIIGLIDNNENNIGKYKYGFKIYDLFEIQDKIDTIIISSDIYQEIIYDRIAHLKEEGIEIIKIYIDMPTIYNIDEKSVNKKYKVIKITEELYDLWNEFVDNSEQGNMFNKTWWLEAVEATFEIYSVIDKNNKIIGGMVLPINEENKVEMPKLTQTLGILFDNLDNCKYTKKLSKQVDIVETLLSVIPKNCSYSINFHYNYTNWLPFMWNGYNQYCRYTYVIEDLNDMNEVRGNFRNGIKYDINKAQKEGLTVKEDLPIEDFYNVNKKVFDKQGMQVPYTLDFIKKFDDILRKKNAAKSFFVVDASGIIKAVNYIVYDEKSAYYLMGGTNEDKKSSGAATLGLWQAINFASKVSCKFDFEGSCIRSIEEFFRGFGGNQKMYFNIWKKEF